MKALVYTNDYTIGTYERQIEVNTVQDFINLMQKEDSDIVLCKELHKGKLVIETLNNNL